MIFFYFYFLFEEREPFAARPLTVYVFVKFLIGGHVGGPVPVEGMLFFIVDIFILAHYVVCVLCFCDL